MLLSRWDEYHFGKCDSVLKLSALRQGNGLHRKQFLHAPYLKSCSPTFLHLTASILWVVCVQIWMSKKDDLVLFQHKGWMNVFHHIPHLKVHLWLILCWTGTDTGRTRLGCWEPQETACTATENEVWPVPHPLKHIPNFMKAQVKLWENCLQQLIGASQGLRKLKMLWKNS